MNPRMNPAEPEHREIPTRRNPKLNLFFVLSVSIPAYPWLSCLFQREPIMSNLLNPVTSDAFSAPYFQRNILYKLAVSDMTGILINSIWLPQ
jgi:hypothetical protein